MRLFFSAGEASGDLHAANLIKALRARTPLQATGLGGPRMQNAGCELLRDMSDLAVMGLVPALVKLPQFFRLLAQVERAWDAQRPDAVVLIDFPGFHWHVARKAKERGIPVYYYGLPQLWAWASWRVKKVQKYVDHALCKLPFEEAWFRSRGCQATYVGHPYFDELRQYKLDSQFLAEQKRPSRLVTILPGSRTQEVHSNLPLLLKAAQQIKAQVPDVRFAIASYNEKQAAWARTLIAKTGAPIEVLVGRTPELIASAECCLACSGSVSLELLYHAKPTVIVYRASWLICQIVRRMIQVRHITLVNLLASPHPVDPPARAKAAWPAASNDDSTIFPEFLTWRDYSTEVAAHAINWLKDEGQRKSVVDRLVALREEVANGGASEAAADYIVRHELGSLQQPSFRRAS